MRGKCTRQKPEGERACACDEKQPRVWVEGLMREG